MASPDLLQAPDGAVQCTACGAGPLDGAQPHPCPVEAARRVLGGAPAPMALALYQRAPDASTARAIAADLRATASELVALIGAAEAPR